MEAVGEDLVLYRGDKGLGFNIQGGVDNPYLPEDGGIFVVKIRTNGAAYKDGKLKEGDKILAINGVQLDGLKHNEAVNHFLDAGDEVRLKIVAGAERAILDSREADYLGPAKHEPNASSLASRFIKFSAVISIVCLGAFVVHKYVIQPRSS